MIVSVVPPRIFRDEEVIHFTGNTREEIIVPFQSRFMDDTNVTWWKNGKPLLGADANHIQQTVTAPPNSTTKLILNPARRNDSGVYEVSVENRFDVIPRRLQVVRLSLTVTVFGKSNVLLIMVVRGVGMRLMTLRVRS